MKDSRHRPNDNAVPLTHALTPRARIDLIDDKSIIPCGSILKASDRINMDGHGIINYQRRVSCGFVCGSFYEVLGRPKAQGEKLRSRSADKRPYHLQNPKPVISLCVVDRKDCNVSFNSILKYAE
jgi:hypothetical protein